MELVRACDRISEALGGEDLDASAEPLVVAVDDEEVVDLDRSERFEHFFLQAGDPQPLATEHQRLAESAEQLDSPLQVFGLHHGSPLPHESALVETRTGRVMAVLEIFGEVGVDRRGVAGQRRRGEPGVERRGPVLSDAAIHGLRLCGGNGEFVEARDRLRFVTDVEELEANQQAVVPENPERPHQSLVSAAADAGRAPRHRLDQRSVFLQAQDVFDPHDEVLDFDERAGPLADLFGAAHRSLPERAVVDQLSRR